ncbi:hypothetical protein B7494_g4973 [Chlorociboria aeruginascens]|nr:hypothetical protein B7494_g4973 [Chlorociboria aeruginascens]
MTSAFTMRPPPLPPYPRDIVYREQPWQVVVVPQSQRRPIELPSIGQDLHNPISMPPANSAEYSLDSYRSINPNQPPTINPAPYPPPPFYYGYQKDSIYATSMVPIHHLPFADHGGYGSQFPAGIEINEFVGHDSKPRKRRGNLPKETTDILRAWFLQHLNHPYPTEDEKQQLMKKTNLQMNQISNWFINARRRQLPAMINNARAENSRTMGNREVSNSDYDDGRSLDGSEGEGSGYSDESDESSRLKEDRGNF